MAEPQNNPRVPDMTVNEMRECCATGIGNATGQSPDSISEFDDADGRAGPVLA